MAQADVDDLAQIFFGEVSQPDCRGIACDSRDSCDSQAFARDCAPVQGVRPAATGCDSGRLNLGQSQKIAGGRNNQHTPQTRTNAQESQKSRQSQGRMPRPAATAATTQEFLAQLAWTDVDIARFAARRDRLIRWRWSITDAEAMAERLTQRDRSGDDRRVCLECCNHRPGRCGNHRAARLNSPEIGSDLAALLQHCPGFRP